MKIASTSTIKQILMVAAISMGTAILYDRVIKDKLPKKA